MSTHETLNGFNESNVFDSVLKDVSLKSKHNVFNKPKLPLQENFNVTFQESNIEDNCDLDIEGSLNFLQKKAKLFSRKEPATETDLSISFRNKTNASLVADNSVQRRKNNENESIELSQTVIVKPTLFNKNNETNNDQMSVNFDQTKINLSDDTSISKAPVFKQPTRNSDHFHVSSNEMHSQTLTEEKLTQELANLNSAVGKSNLFQKPPEKLIKDPFEIDSDDFTNSCDSEGSTDRTSVFRNENQEERTFNVTYNTSTSQKKAISDMDKIDNNHIENNNAVNKPTENEKNKNKVLNDNKEGEEIIRKEDSHVLAVKSVPNDNLSMHSSKGQTKSEHSESYVDQSSFSGDYPQCWNSDHSDEEIIPPSVPGFVMNAASAKDVICPTEKILKKQMTLPNTWIKKFDDIVENANQKINFKVEEVKLKKKDTQKKCPTNCKNLNKLKPQKLNKPAPFITKFLYQFLIDKLKPKFGILSTSEAEKLVISISNTVKTVIRRKNYQKKLINDLKKNLAKAGIVETTVDFHEFIIKFLPHKFRIKVIPCVQPVTNNIYPPRDVTNPFDKIL